MPAQRKRECFHSLSVRLRQPEQSRLAQTVEQLVEPCNDVVRTGCVCYRCRCFRTCTGGAGRTGWAGRADCACFTRGAGRAGRADCACFTRGAGRTGWANCACFTCGAGRAGGADCACFTRGAGRAGGANCACFPPGRAGAPPSGLSGQLRRFPAGPVGPVGPTAPASPRRAGWANCACFPGACRAGSTGRTDRSREARRSRRTRNASRPHWPHRSPFSSRSARTRRSGRSGRSHRARSVVAHHRIAHALLPAFARTFPVAAAVLSIVHVVLPFLPICRKTPAVQSMPKAALR